MTVSWWNAPLAADKGNPWTNSLTLSQIQQISRDRQPAPPTTLWQDIQQGIGQAYQYMQQSRLGPIWSKDWRFGHDRPQCGGPACDRQHRRRRTNRWVRVEPGAGQLQPGHGNGRAAVADGGQGPVECRGSSANAGGGDGLPGLRRDGPKSNGA